MGLDGILVVTPYYNRPSQNGLQAHFEAVCAATDLPVMVYDIPVRTGRKISNDVLVDLADEHPQSRRPQGRGRRSGRDRQGDRSRARARGLQRRRPADAPAPGRRRGRGRRRRDALVWRADVRDVRGLLRRRRGPRRGTQRPHDRVVRVRDGRRRTEPVAGQGHAADARPPGRPGPPPDGRPPTGLEDEARAVYARLNG